MKINPTLTLILSLRERKKRGKILSRRERKISLPFKGRVRVGMG
ncbi:MAG: hypothetical protein Q8P28_04830 [Deltaproteobacteria bacterium]|nr:hypothetical protein [Deltaproteobacteria bacterium]